MSEAFVPFWRLRQHAVAEEAVRGGSRRRRTGESWALSPELVDRLRSLLVEEGLDPGLAILVEERSGEDGFRLSQA